MGEEKKLDQESIAAIQKLETFLWEKAQHEGSLQNILLDENGRYSETAMTVTLAEHLFKKLAPGQNYAIDNRTSGKNECACGSKNCKHEKHFECTGIGDVNSSSGRNIIEVKCSLERSRNAVKDQATAQTIVFSFLQRETHLNLFIPNILISPDEFRIIMYDADNDILICSESLCIVDDSESLENSSIILIWMVLHYETFLEDVTCCFKNGDRIMQKYQAELSYEARQKYRNAIKFCEEKGAGSTDKAVFPDSKSLSEGENVCGASIDKKFEKLGIDDNTGSKSPETKKGQ